LGGKAIESTGKKETKRELDAIKKLLKE